MNTIVDLEIKLWKKLMKFNYYRTLHNQIFYIFKYDELIQKQIIGNNYPIGKIKNPPPHHPIFFIPSLSVMIMAFIYIGQFEWIKNYQFYRTCMKILPNEGLHYLMVTMIIWSLNALLNVKHTQKKNKRSLINNMKTLFHII
ncbi:hypothetical protein DERF_001192 [Dermatophagoides farinae]|uniref:Uncharacterized protein n=1 Tax=Dermatophagoides farinae TaxID=6954 RepID=A0A922I846_DERFA|nr:hypothetical protein DERF_001192 [Dermatophagoides farinae]